MKDIAFDFFFGHWKAIVGNLAGEVVLQAMPDHQNRCEIVWARNRQPLQDDLVYDPITFTLKNDQFSVSLWGRQGLPFDNQIFTISNRLGSGGDEQFGLWGAVRVGKPHSDGDLPRSPKRPVWDMKAKVVQKFPRGQHFPPPPIPGQIEIRPSQHGGDYDIFVVGDPKPYDILIGHDESRSLVSKVPINNLSRTISQWQRDKRATNLFAMLSMPRQQLQTLRKLHDQLTTRDHQSYMDLARRFNLLPFELAALMNTERGRPQEDSGVIVWGAEDEG